MNQKKLLCFFSIKPLEEIRYLEVELEKVEKRLLQSEAERGKAEQYVQMLEQNDINLKKDNKLLKQEVGSLQQDVDAKDSLVCLLQYCLFMSGFHEAA